ncbi:hypothetical protein HMPREF0058_1920, partial [Actinomyces urogenitalis DSM 15434]
MIRDGRCLATELPRGLRACLGHKRVILSDATWRDRDGWRVDGGPGFVYTTDFAGEPVVHERMHWVVCEGVSAAA